MSDENGTQDTDAGSPGKETGSPAKDTATPGKDAGVAAGPRPEPLRFFGTTWVNHDDGYTPRRIAAAVGSLAAAVASCLILRFAYQGLQIADVGSFVTLLVIVMFAVCSALAFGHTWESFKKRPDPDRQASLRGLLGIGFVGSLLAYFFRTFTEAPGENLRRQEYEAALTQHKKRTTRRTGNPAKKRREK
ncbi:EamA/RhaT family transporter [Streptomyces sp. NPDC091280]|uniref:EamA/RhaT family transporter n=1 Tax=Streptomyces sp. NPDC091280 TaxID=3365984 RepID=UPI0037F152F1